MHPSRAPARSSSLTLPLSSLSHTLSSRVPPLFSRLVSSRVSSLFSRRVSFRVPSPPSSRLLSRLVSHLLSRLISRLFSRLISSRVSVRDSAIAHDVGWHSLSVWVAFPSAELCVRTIACEFSRPGGPLVRACSLLSVAPRALRALASRLLSFVRLKH